jgi:hypothetical protein
MDMAVTGSPKDGTIAAISELSRSQWLMKR